MNINAKPAGRHETKEKKKAKIEVDNHPRHVTPGDHIVSELKGLVDVLAEKDLDQVVDGKLTTLADDSIVHIKGGEIFFSHVRRGGSS